MKIKEEIKPKLEDFILDFINQYSKRNVDHQQFCNYVYKLIDNGIESEEIDEIFCITKLEDFFGNKSARFIKELVSLIRNEEQIEKSESTPMEALMEEDEKEIFDLVKSESSPEESEGKNIFKYKRDFSDEDESDEDVQDKDRGHKRRKSSHQNSMEKEKDEKENKLKLNFPKTIGFENQTGLNHQPYKKQQQMPITGYPYPPAFLPPNPMNAMFKKKFPNNMNKKMMMPQYNPSMFFPPHLYPSPMGFPSEYFLPPHNYAWNPPPEKLQPAKNEYDPLNPSNNLLQSSSNPNPSSFFESSKPNSTYNNTKHFPSNKAGSDNNKDLSKLLIERNSGKKDLEEKEGHNKDSEDKNRKTNPKSPKKSDKKVRDTIYIKNIPNYYNSVETLSKFYKKFGSIENIQVEQSKMLASVKFMKALDAVKAVNSNKKLFGKEEIFVTLNPEEEPPKKNTSVNTNLSQIFSNNENKNNSNKEGVNTNNIPEKKDIKKNKPVNSLLEGKFSKFQEIKNKKEKEGIKDMIKKKLANKLKFLLYLKNRIEKIEMKNELINEINKIKNYKNEIEKGTFDETLKEQLEKENLNPSFDYTLILNNLPENMLNYTVLQTKLEVHGKIESLKIFKKENKTHVKYASFETAEKAYLNDHEFLLEFLDKNLLNFLKAEIKEKSQSNLITEAERKDTETGPIEILATN